MRFLASKYKLGVVKTLYYWIFRRNKMLWLKTNCHSALYKLTRQAVRHESLQHRLFHKELWHRGIVNEFEWWEYWLTTDEGLKWQTEVQDPQRLIQDPLITDRINTIFSGPISILDVGAGPITGLGYTYPGRVINITAVDPLANEYDRMLKKANIIPRVRTSLCHGEHLLKKFEPESFDFTYASNSLDHSYNPLLTIKNMLNLIKKNGFVILRHYKNEGKTGDYDGLHQWNFDISQSNLIIWSKIVECNVTRILRSEAQVEAYYERSANCGFFDYSDWVVCIITKL